MLNFFSSLPQPSSSKDKCEATNTTSEKPDTFKNPSLTVINLDEARNSLSHSRKSTDAVDENFSDKPSGDSPL